MQAVTGEEPARSIEGLFNRMAAGVPAFAGVEWARIGDAGVTVQL